MNINYEFRGNDVFEIHEPQINGSSWRIARKIGIGTYARIASEDEEEDDENEVIEEYSSHEYRNKWDSMTELQLIEAVYEILAGRI